MIVKINKQINTNQWWLRNSGDWIILITLNVNYILVWNKQGNWTDCIDLKKKKLISALDIPGTFRNALWLSHTSSAPPLGRDRSADRIVHGSPPDSGPSSSWPRFGFRPASVPECPGNWRPSAARKSSPYPGRGMQHPNRECCPVAWRRTLPSEWTTSSLLRCGPGRLVRRVRCDFDSNDTIPILSRVRSSERCPPALRCRWMIRRCCSSATCSVGFRTSGQRGGPRGRRCHPKSANGSDAGNHN